MTGHPCGQGLQLQLNPLMLLGVRGGALFAFPLQTGETDAQEELTAVRVFVTPAMLSGGHPRDSDSNMSTGHRPHFPILMSSQHWDRTRRSDFVK